MIDLDEGRRLWAESDGGPFDFSFFCDSWNEPTSDYLAHAANNFPAALDEIAQLRADAAEEEGLRKRLAELLSEVEP